MSRGSCVDSVQETVNDDSHGAFNLVDALVGGGDAAVAGFGAAAGRCYDPAAVSCNACAPPSYCTSTTLADAEASHVLVEDVDCAAGQNSWKEHLFVLVWQPHEISAFLDPKLSFNSQGQLVAIQEKIRPGAPTFKTYQRDTTPTWSAVQDYMQKCFPGPHSPDAPFDIPMKIVLNIAVGGYGGAPCYWGEKTCASGPSPALRDQTRSASNPSSGMEVEVELNGLAGELCCIMAPISSSLADLKLLWQGKIKVPVDEQRLFLGCRELYDEDRLGALVAAPSPGATPRVALSLVRRSPTHAKLLKLAQDGSQALSRKWLAKMPEVVRGDAELVREVLRRDGVALQYASEDLKAHPQLVLEAVRRSGFALEYAAEHLRGDRQFVLEAVKQNGFALARASAKLQGDPEVILAAIKEEGAAFEYAAQELKGDFDFALEVVSLGGPGAMKHISADLWEDPRFVLHAVRQAPSALEHAQAEVKAEPTFVLELLSRSPAALPFVAAELLEDPAFLLRAVERNPEALAHVPSEMAMEPAFILMALRCNGHSLRYVNRGLLKEKGFALQALGAAGAKALVDLPEDFWQDRDLALTALRIDESGIEKVPKKFWTDRDFVLAAARFQPSVLNMVEPGWLKEQPFILSVLQRNSSCIRFVSEELLKDRAFVLQALRTHGSVLKHLPQEMRADPSLVLAAVPQTGFVLGFAADELRLDKCFVLQAVKINGYALIGTPEVMRSDREVVLAAVRQQGQCLEFATPALRADPEIVLAAIRSCPGPMAHVEECLWKDPAFVLEAAALHACAIQHADDALRLNRPFLLSAFERNPECICYVHPQLQSDRSFFIECLALNPHALEFVPTQMRIDVAFQAAAKSQISPEEATKLPAAGYQPVFDTMILGDKNRDGVQDLAQVNSASNVFARIVARSKGLPLPVVYNCNTGQGWTMWKDVPFSADSGLMSVLIPVGGMWQGLWKRRACTDSWVWTLLHVKSIILPKDIW
ncbi:Ubiquitin-like domain-containing protein [Durusdinium trenchii]|uniref:Ubiquitin-like domain-containing protein n=1 Tax=Durusdinium trenchii TaxID=1381693 RepID=A0ABP0HVW8_9DINO